MAKVDLDDSLHKLVVSKVLLDSKRKTNIDNFENVIPDIHNICRTDSGSIVLEFVTPVSMDLYKIQSEVGEVLISQSILNNLWTRAEGYYINLSHYLYLEYKHNLLSMEKIHLSCHGNAANLRDGLDRRFFLYKLIEFDPRLNMYEHILFKMGEAIQTFKHMRDAVYTSLNYKMKQAERHQADSQKSYTSPSFVYEMWRQFKGIRDARKNEYRSLERR